ncbi:hypothetical protein [Microbacterium oxydans]|uniref:hypothetical protein n=1 Tax=Microbacterium oxydans TaxID=82380 RepID=UPI003672EBAC
MNNNVRNHSARAYLDEVTIILCDLPTPVINAAAMRGAGIRFSSPAEGIPGPRRLILDGLVAGQPLATGMTATALLARQRGNLAYLDDRRDQLATEAEAAKAMASPDLAGRNDHAFEVIDTLCAVPLLTGDFTVVFGKLADLADLVQRDGKWEVRTIDGETNGIPLEDLGRGFSLDALRAATDANAARYRRWRNAIRHVEDRDIPSEGSSPELGRNTRRPTDPVDHLEMTPSFRDVRPDAPDTAALEHHKRSLSNGILADRRRRFPELFSDVALASGISAASSARTAGRRRRFPELDQYCEQSALERRGDGGEFLGLA